MEKPNVTATDREKEHYKHLMAPIQKSDQGAIGAQQCSMKSTSILRICACYGWESIAHQRIYFAYLLKLLALRAHIAGLAGL